MDFINVSLEKMLVAKRLARAIVYALGPEKSLLVEMQWDEREQVFVFRLNGDVTMDDLSFVLACQGVPYRLQPGLGKQIQQ